jgi:hypothetical protein
MSKRTILEEIRHVRHEISEKIHHDPQQINDYYHQIQQDLKHRIINRSGQVHHVDTSNLEPATSNVIQKQTTA